MSIFWSITNFHAIFFDQSQIVVPFWIWSISFNANSFHPWQIIVPFFFASFKIIMCDWETRAKNGENAFLLRVASVAKRKCNL